MCRFIDTRPVQANSDEANPAARLSDADLLDQLSTFLFGGTDTLTTGIAWTLHLLSLHADWQDRLRQDVFGIINQDVENMVSNLDCNIVLDHIVRESLRVAPPVHATIR